MRNADLGHSTTGLASPVVVGFGFLLLGLAPVIRGGNRHVALVLLEWVSLLVLLALTIQALSANPTGSPAHRLERRRAAGVWLLALAPFWVALFQLFPLPSGWWKALPGHVPYAEGLAVARVSGAGYFPMSLTPDFTLLSVLAGLPLSAALLVAYHASARHLGLLVQGLIVFAVVQAVLGLLQMGPFPALSFGSERGGRAIGTFANRNHFASYITMTVPLAVWMLSQAMAPVRRTTSSQGVRAKGALWGVALFLLLSGVLVSASRGGAVTCLVVTVLAAMLLRHRAAQGSFRHHWGLAGVATLLALVALAAGVDALLARFEGEGDYLDSERWLYVIGTWHAAREFWPFGAGLGSFASVFPAYQPLGVHGFVEHAHNDYVQLLMEGGLLVVVLSLVALALIFRQVAALVRHDRRSGLDPQALLQVACGLGLLAVLLHSWVEFNLRIPANAILAAFLLGAFLRPLAEPASWRRGGMDAS